MNHGVQLNWQESTTGCSFNIYRSITNDGNWGSPLASVGVGVTTYTDATGTAGQVYFYSVSAVLNGIESILSSPAQVTFPTVPSFPTNLTAVVV